MSSKDAIPRISHDTFGLINTGLDVVVII